MDALAVVAQIRRHQFGPALASEFVRLRARGPIAQERAIQAWRQLEDEIGERDENGKWVAPSEDDVLAVWSAPRLPKGDGERVQFRTSKAIRLALLARAEAEGITEREAWERAGMEWANRG